MIACRRLGAADGGVAAVGEAGGAEGPNELVGEEGEDVEDVVGRGPFEKVRHGEEVTELFGWWVGG